MTKDDVGSEDRDIASMTNKASDGHNEVARWRAEASLSFPELDDLGAISKPRHSCTTASHSHH